MKISEPAALLLEGERLLQARLLPEATKYLDRAEHAGADQDRCAAARWMLSMLSGDFEAAWQQSDAIRQRGNHDPHRFWRGESLAGKRVILRCLHGFGDAVQFLRSVPRLRAIASTLVVEVPPRFVALAHCFDGVDQVITWGEQAPEQPPAWDVQVEIMELPYLFRVQRCELPLAVNYLRLPPCAALKTLPSGHLRVGLAWNAGSWNTTRAIAPELLQPILATPQCEFWDLNGTPDRGENAAPITATMHQLASCRDSIEGLAATIAQLDLVITVDTLAAHLAGALGVKAWVLLQHAADWRWMDRCYSQETSPWYPTLTLFRQPAPDDWQTVIAIVCRALHTAANPEA